MLTPTKRTNIQVSSATRSTLHALADASGATIDQVLDEALELYRSRRLLDESNAAYRSLRADPKAWAEIEAERAAWDATLDDNLEPD